MTLDRFFSSPHEYPPVLDALLRAESSGESGAVVDSTRRLLAQPR